MLGPLEPHRRNCARQAYRASLEPLSGNGLALLAVGGFGRRELFPYSDVDILILLDRETRTPLQGDALSEFVRLLWDSGLRLSHSVHTIGECLKSTNTISS